MSPFAEKLTNQWQDACNFALGLWLALSPWALSYTHETTAAWNAHIAGVIIAVAALAALVAFQKWEEWGNAVLAAWLIASPYILGFSHFAPALWNQILIGAAVGVLAVWAAVERSDGGVAAQS